MSIVYLTLPVRVNVIEVADWPGFYWGVRIEQDAEQGTGFTQLSHGRALPYATRAGALRAGRAAAYKWASHRCDIQQGYRNAPSKSHVDKARPTAAPGARVRKDG